MISSFVNVRSIFAASTHSFNFCERRVSAPALSKSEWINISVNYNFFINTTHFDNTPVSIIEAMALGLPIISTNVGGMPFLIEHGQEGLLSDDSDVPAMVKNIKRLLESPNLAETLSRNARKKAESFDWKLVEKQWIQLFSAIPQ